MILKNMCKIIMKYTTGNQNGTQQLKAASGSDIDVTHISASNAPVNCYFYSTSSVIGGSLDGVGLCFGSGTTPPTADDYKLENRISVSTADFSQGYTADNRSSFTVTLNGEEDTTEINEYGFFRAYSGASGYASVLLTRSVLPEPLVIKKGEIKSVTVTIDWDKLTDTLVSA